MKSEFLEVTEEYIKEILKLSKEMFGGNLYIKCDFHPCGWDKIDIEDIEDIYSSIPIENISNNIYNEHQFEDISLYDIINQMGINGWSFVPPTICPDDLSMVGI